MKDKKKSNEMLWAPIFLSIQRQSVFSTVGDRRQVVGKGMWKAKERDPQCYQGTALLPILHSAKGLTRYKEGSNGSTVV